jgi:hypothetical protein
MYINIVHFCKPYISIYLEIGRSAKQSVSSIRRHMSGQVESRALLTGDEYVGDDWLEDDLGFSKRSKRKRQDTQVIYSYMHKIQK